MNDGWVSTIGQNPTFSWQQVRCAFRCFLTKHKLSQHFIWYLVPYGVFMSLGNFWMKLLMNKWTDYCHGWWMRFIHWPKPYLLLATTYDEILSWMIEIWMRNHLVSDNTCNTVNVQSPKKWQGMTINVGLTFSVGSIRPQFRISMEQDD
jgi:hypothetical protein